MPDSRHFYRNLVAVSTFEDTISDDHNVALPEDWSVIVADVVDSTIAIEAGKYKQVNTVGVATIAAIINVDREIDFPYLFGGDGALLAVPPCMLAGVRTALLGSQKVAKQGFGLRLRIGLVPVKYLTANGYGVEIVKFRASEHVVQAATKGKGWEKAEELVKTTAQFEIIPSSTDAEADFTGFECRWDGVRSRRDHKISVVIQAMSENPSARLATYHKVMDQIAAIYGDPSEYHPLTESNMNLTLNPFKLVGEAKLKVQRRKLKQFLFALKHLVANVMGRILFRQKIDTKKVKWTDYRADVIKNCDFRKYDGMLKMVLDGSNEQSAKLQDFLANEYALRQLVYGTHVSKEALITCFVFSHQANHLHFVDGADGGYAVAAKRLKERLQAFSKPSETSAMMQPG